MHRCPDITRSTHSKEFQRPCFFSCILKDLEIQIPTPPPFLSFLGLCIKLCVGKVATISAIAQLSPHNL